MNLQPVLEFLASKGHGARGRNLFREFMPAEVDEGVLLTAQMPQALNPYNNDQYRGDFQVIVRGREIDAVRNRAVDILNELTLRGVGMGNMQFFYIQPKHSPLLYPKSDGQLIEASVNYECAYLII